MMSTSKMTGSPSFHELFDENGHIRKCENVQQEDEDINSASIMQHRSGHISSSRSHDYEHDTCTNEVNHTSAANQTITIHSAASQSQSQCSSTINHMSSSINQQQQKHQADGERPHSSYCKTRSALNSFSDTPSLQLNISPGSVPIDSDAHHLHSLLLQHNSNTPITPPSTFLLQQQNSHYPTSDTSASNNMNGLSLNSPSSDAFSPPVTQQSSLFLTDGPPPPPAPQASNHQDVLNDDHDLDDPESFLSSLSLLHYNPYPSPQPSSTKNKHGNFHHRSHSTPPPRLLSSFSSKKKNQKSISLFSSVPLDALHCIAGFLTMKEWLTLSLINSEALGVCREVMNKVRMHGFKCAVEVVSAWVSSF